MSPSRDWASRNTYTVIVALLRCLQVAIRSKEEPTPTPTRGLPPIFCPGFGPDSARAWPGPRHVGSIGFSRQPVGEGAELVLGAGKGGAGDGQHP